ncbi:uncharacterized protein MYCFIDRAFT_201126 [Pseudocercospora fijiensis CIRAD86]|uniref:VPS37 C-terminal domain-containing protein n=1 Tax=Pseudocercospora fijiensis (strain CIRAD86) TaxID=383855 RepID=N1Q799_PSEFD|nr:uncharacterized protein MYCFIDRAFT_201126 [Pseudocercospora fijiensis CIRAD86]EME87446.1 hypothetical protein MYCFIDRAFT_201126 [Pseudocercospora fijiensis CIRAD86]
MSYTPQPYSPAPQSNYYSTPPAPPPKQASGTSTPARGPPLPPPPPGQYQTEPSELDGAQHYYPQQQQQQQGPPQPSIPPMEGNWLPETLKDKSANDLQHILSTPSLQNALLLNPSTTHPAVPASEAYLTPLISSNLQIATQLEETEAKLAALRERTQSRLLALRALEQQHRTKLNETEDALREFSPMALYQRLNASVQEQELMNRGLEESWLEEDDTATDKETADFVRRMKEGEKTAFLRRERKARWDEGRVGGWR